MAVRLVNSIQRQPQWLHNNVRIDTIRLTNFCIICCGFAENLIALSADGTEVVVVGGSYKQVTMCKLVGFNGHLPTVIDVVQTVVYVI